MNIQFEFAPWGVFFAGMMYVIGNGAWANHVVRQKVWLGWLFWGVCALLVLVVAALFESRLDPQDGGIADHLTKVDLENHWIAVTLFALLSVPGAASVMFRQSIAWTRIAILAPALIVFIPVGRQLANPEDNYLLLSLGVALGVCGLVWLWLSLLDCEPETRGNISTREANL
ncbi:MAG: hypothetical protein Q9M29_01085 [Mariprofundaceae bacterium]|nr:hypothetical protein [Mariprofundaceae bacterium]